MHSMRFTIHRHSTAVFKEVKLHSVFAHGRMRSSPRIRQFRHPSRLWRCYVHSSMVNRVPSEIPYLAFRDDLLEQPSVERCAVPMIFSLGKRASHWSLAVERAPVGFKFFDRRHSREPVLFDVFVAWQWTRRILWNRSTVRIDADYHWSDQIWACVLRRWSHVITRRSGFLAQAVCFAVTGGCNEKRNVYN